jgi:hypothetical protein
VWVESDDLWLLERGKAAGASQVATGWQDLRRPRTIADLAAESAQAGVAGPGGHPPLLYYARPAALEAMQRGATPDQPGGITSGVDDLSARVRVRLEGSLAFGTVAAYFPERPSLSLEPRTALSDAIPLTAEDAAALTGLRALGPGEHWRAWAKVSCEALP